MNDLPFNRQLSLVLDMRRQYARQPYTPADVARATSIPLQTLLYLLDGTSISPRLDTARRLCACFEISLDYFDCESEADCEHFLVSHWLVSSPTGIREIADEAEQLSPRGQRNVLSMIELIRRAIS